MSTRRRSRLKWSSGVLCTQANLGGVFGRRNCKRTIRYDKDCYRGRHLLENAFCRLKDFRRIATRYGKLAANFLSGVAFATAVAVGL